MKTAVIYSGLKLAASDGTIVDYSSLACVGALFFSIVAIVFLISYYSCRRG